MDIRRNKLIFSNEINTDKKTRFVWLGSYILISVIFIVTFFLIHFQVLKIPYTFNRAVEKFSLAGFFIIAILAAAKIIEIIIIQKTHSKYKKYNLIRITKLFSFIASAILFISFLFSNWYTAAVSLGLISLIIGFALQTPISSFIGWIYIIIRNPFRIGERIQINEIKGDVIEIGYLDTTLWEFAGDYLTNDLPSGRLIRFPNSLVLQSPVFNYSWHNFHFIWNEIPFHVAYESNLTFIEKVIKRITKEELGPEMENHIEKLKDLVKNSPIDETEIKDYPFVSFRINSNTWVEVTVTYLVSPRQAASIRSKIIKSVLNELIQYSDKSMFPKSNAR
jgi:small-conductance mechanosensitive channel